MKDCCHNRAGLLFLMLALVTATVAVADPIYRQINKDGSITYSSKSPSPAAPPADLPLLQRSPIGKDPKEKTIQSCRQHGGVDCHAGADTDGSVVCLDGFTAAVERFLFSCSEAKLRIAEISALGTDGGFSVFVRNEKSVTAQVPKLFWKANDSEEILLEGPTEIAAFELGEFKFVPAGKVELRSPKRAQLRVSCQNCS